MACQERQTGLRHRYRLRQTKSQGAGELVDMGQTSRKKRRTQKVLGKLERVERTRTHCRNFEILCFTLTWSFVLEVNFAVDA